MSNIIRIQGEHLQKVFSEILIKNGLNAGKALQCAEVFTANSIDGVYTHGVNRFPVFVQYIKDGFINTVAEPTLQSDFAGVEQWDGNLGPGPLNAIHATNRVIHLSRQYGIGCVALARTNHWMRGGYYGWLAARENKILIAWTNTIANMPAWNAVDRRLGNNPLVLALPYGGEAIVLDMAMSQFSFGALEMAAMKKEKLPVQGGYDDKGNLTNDPAAIIETGRLLPAGYWKGAGLSLLLDVLATVISGGFSTGQITAQGSESGVSQVFICIDPEKFHNVALVEGTIHGIISNYNDSVSSSGKKVSYPGERVLQTRKNNQVEGIPVLKEVWDKILQL